MKSVRRLLWGLGVVVMLMAVSAGLAFWLRPVSFFHAYNDLRLQMSGMESRSTRVAGCRVHYYVDGPKNGAPVVLIHGLGGRAQDWRNLAPYLIRSGFRVYLPDLPGYGHSEKPADFSYSITDEADAVVGFMDALGLKQVNLGGWSMGGWVVQRVAIAHPERVRRLMLFDSAGLYMKPDWDIRLFTPQTEGEVYQLDALLMPHPPQVPGFVMRDILRVSGRNAWVIHRAISSMMTGQDVTDAQLPQLKMPVLILWGEEDRITPLSEGQRLNALIPQSQLMAFPGCGHLAPDQCADRLGPAAAQFVGK